MHDAVERYSAPPYNVKYWEIYNEPDAPKNTNEPPYGMIYGCWGISGDTYFGGEAYGEMLKVVYPYIKSANSSAQVLVGGLLLDCDPRTVCTTGPGSIPPKFLNGILSALS
jgi:alpha-L-arabinofuranosidase